MLKQSNLEFSAICLQESCIADGEDISQIQLEDYNCISKGWSCTSKGGLILYLNNKFKYVDKMKLNNSRTREGQVIQVNKDDCLARTL